MDGGVDTGRVAGTAAKYNFNITNLQWPFTIIGNNSARVVE